MKNNQFKSIWELAYDTRVKFAAVISLIVIPVLIFVYFNGKADKYINRCMEKELYEKSLNVVIGYENPVKYEKIGDYYALFFSNNRVLYSCAWESSIDENKKYHVMDESILNKKINKSKGSDIFYVEDNSINVKYFYLVKWTNE